MDVDLFQGRSQERICWCSDLRGLHWISSYCSAVLGFCIPLSQNLRGRDPNYSRIDAYRPPSPLLTLLLFAITAAPAATTTTTSTTIKLIILIIDPEEEGWHSRQFSSNLKHNFCLNPEGSLTPRAKHNLSHYNNYNYKVIYNNDRNNSAWYTAHFHINLFYRPRCRPYGFPSASVIASLNTRM